MKREILSLQIATKRPVIHRLSAGFALALLASQIGACSVTGAPRPAEAETRGFELKDLGKSDIDTVTDTAIVMLEADMRQLVKKLYARNPVQLRKRPGKTLAGRMQQLFGPPGALIYDETQGKTSTAAMDLALNPAYKGDRVFALMVGLVDMIHRSYNYNREFFMLDQLDQQKLYNTARNIEILVWQLKHHVGANGKPLILTNGSGNLSYERLFGKMIAIQDLMAEVIAKKRNRSISRVVQGVASMVFLPI